MAYTPTTWKTGDKVTAEKLNKIEQGIVDAEQSGSSLPDYSEASDGDVLSIDNGAPAWKEASGGGGGGDTVTWVTETIEEVGETYESNVITSINAPLWIKSIMMSSDHDVDVDIGGIRMMGKDFSCNTVVRVMVDTDSETNERYFYVDDFGIYYADEEVEIYGQFAPNIVEVLKRLIIVKLTSNYTIARIHNVHNPDVEDTTIIDYVLDNEVYINTPMSL